MQFTNASTGCGLDTYVLDCIFLLYKYFMQYRGMSSIKNKTHVHNNINLIN